MKLRRLKVIFDDFKFPIILGLIAVIIDFISSFTRIISFEIDQLIFYTISILLSIGFISLLYAVLKKLSTKKRWKYYLFFFTFIPFWILSIIGSYLFKSINGVFPNKHTFIFIKNEPLNAWLLIEHSIGIFGLICLIILIIYAAYFSRKKLKDSGKTISNKSLVIYVITQLVLFEILFIMPQKFEQCGTIDLNFVINLQNALISLTEENHMGTLKERNPKEIQKSDTIKIKKDFNVLVIILESARKNTMSIYNNSIETTPKLNSFIANNSQNITLFKEPKTIATATMLALPSILNGIGPYQSKSDVFSEPLIWEYAQLFDYKTFFLSSHNFESFSFLEFFKKNKLDEFYCQDNSGHPLFNELGMDDKHITSKFLEKISEYKTNSFFGVMQYNTTHYPYTVPDAFKKWGESTIMDNYLNAMFYQDHLLDIVFKGLDKEGLLKNTVVFVLSDHAESLDEHNITGHLESNYLETIDIPFLMYVPENILSKSEQFNLKENTNKIVSNIDLCPTIIDLLNLENDTNLYKHIKKHSGYSLFKPIPQDRYVITCNSNSYSNLNTGISIINNKWHYLFRGNVFPNSEELYFWKNDPKELRNYGLLIPKNTKEFIISIVEKYEDSRKFGSKIKEIHH